MSAEDGPLVTQAYVCNARGENLILQDITLPPLKATQVELDMKYCGLCHTDIHMKGSSRGFLLFHFPLLSKYETLSSLVFVFFFLCCRQ